MTLEHERTSELIQKFGWNSTCSQILNPGMKRWFSPNDEAVIGYVQRGSSRIVAGAPVCPQRNIVDVVTKFDELREGLVLYFAAESRLHQKVQFNPRYSSLIIGSQPVWCPAEFVSRFEGSRSLRQQRNRALNKGITVREITCRPDRDGDELDAIQERWLRRRPLPPLQFLVEPVSAKDSHQKRTYVANYLGQPIGYVTLAPIPLRNGWLCEQIVRDPEAPNGTTELILLAAARAIASEGATFLTLGMVPLSSQSGYPMPTWLSLTSSVARRHGHHWYDFQGLERFKQKFQPEAWEPVYLIANQPTISPSALYTALSAFTQGSPLRILVRSLLPPSIRLADRGSLRPSRALPCSVPSPGKP